MKTRFFKLTALILSLAVTLSLALPALAFEDADPPLWQEWGYGSLEEALAENGLTRAEYEDLVSQELAARGWLAAHPEEAAAFDPYAYFAEEYDWFDSPQEYMEIFERTQEEFEQEMRAEWVRGKLDEVEQAEWLAAHPEEAAAFDPYAYFAEEYPWYDSLEEFLENTQWSQEEFERRMLNSWARDRIAAEERDRKVAAFKAEHAEECAAFDPYAYFAENYFFWSDDPQEYMESMGLTEEEFYQDMFLEWMEQFQAMLQVKEQFGGTAKGINVMVNGQCVPFPDARPEVKNGRTMAPLRATMEALGAQVSYNGSDDIRCAVDGVQYTFAVGDTGVKLRYIDYDGEGEAPDMEGLIMDCAPYIKNGRTYIPVRFFAEAFGYEVLWDQTFQTAVLLDRQKLIDSIDQDFTLLSRLIYAASGADQIKTDQAMEQSVQLDLDLTLFDTLHGDKRIPADLSASALVGDKAIEVTVSGDLSGLIDYLADSGSMYIDEAELAQLRAAMARFSARVILNLEVGAVYLHCPALAQIEPDLGDPDTWFGFPLDLSELSQLGLPSGSLPQPGTVGQLIWDNGAGSPFWRWSAALKSAEELKSYLSDGKFTKSGSSYTLSFEETNYAWDGGEEVYAFKLTITPAGDRSCTYTVTFGLTSDDMVVDASLKGSSGRADLDLSLHLKNILKLTLEGVSRISGSERSPLSQPPKGSKIQFPAGAIGSGNM